MKQFGELDTNLLIELQKKFNEIIIVTKKGYILGDKYRKLWDVYPFPEVITSFNEVLKKGKSSCTIRENEKTYLLKFEVVQDLIFILKTDISLQADYKNIKKNIISTLSHEIKTPLASAIGNIEYLLSYGDCSEREILEEVFEKLKKLASIVGGIENLFKDSLMNFRWINLRPLIEEVANEVKSELKEKSKDIKLILRLDDVSIPADKILFSQMVRNLIDNAVNFTEKGKIEIELTENYLRISDTGTGIEEEILPKIFDRFVKGEKSSGQGIGLSIVKEIAKFHNWKIDVKSKKREGTVFTIYFNK